MADEVLFSQRKHIGLVTLNRPSALNAINIPMIKAMQKQLIEWEQDQSIKAVVIHTDNPKAFCAGGDVRWLYEKGLAKDPEQLAFFWHEYRLNHYIHHYPKPYVALMDGITMGGGIGISLHGSHPVASERAIFAMPETSIGLFPDIGASYLLNRCPAKTGLYAALTGNRLSAQQALAVGLVKQLVPAGQMDNLLTALCEVSFDGNDSFKSIDQCVQGFAVKSEPLNDELTNLEQYFAKDNVDAIIEALQASSDEWARTQAANLLQKSPTALKVTFEQIKRAANLSLADCLKMDYGLVQHFMSDHDFYEGVRALLVDKDKAPKWQPACLAAVSSERVMGYFDNHVEKLKLINE